MNMVELAARIKAARTGKGFTLDRVAEISGLGKGLLSKVENFRVTPSLPTLARITEALGLTMSELLDGLDAKPQISIVRAADRREVERDQSDVRYFSLAHGRPDRSMDPFELVIPPHGGRRDPMPHEGEEFLIVLEGTVGFDFGDLTYQLAAGDAVYFDAETQHRVYNNTGDPARVLCLFLGRPL
ncbi:MAG: cupin domain-containing protein [Verrucomicrobia bacterium]|nr:cupin domain-containing protein [Verrucomicrobiota bacterium]